MSFPYRLISAITSNQAAQVIFLRLINVGIFALGLELYRRVFKRIGVSSSLTNSLFALLILVPVVPFLAAHINYDNLFFTAVALTTLLAAKLLASFRTSKVDVQTGMVLLATLFLSSLIKYPFLPIAVVTGLFIIWQGWRDGLITKKGWLKVVKNFHALSRARSIALIALVLLSFGLFTERYVANVITYHDPVPACDAVISQDECALYGPYGRDHILAQQKPADFHPKLLTYIHEWLYGMWYRLFFAVNYDYATAPPLTVISYTAVGLLVSMVLGMLLQFRYLFRGQPTRQLMLGVMVGYTLVLFLNGFTSYAKTAQPVAINGRYLIPFLPFLFALGGLAWAQMLRKWPVSKTALATVVIAAFLLQGGGAMTFIIRSGDTWMWDNNAVRATNRVVRSAAWPFIPYKDRL